MYRCAFRRSPAGLGLPTSVINGPKSTSTLSPLGGTVAAVARSAQQSGFSLSPAATALAFESRGMSFHALNFPTDTNNLYFDTDITNNFDTNINNTSNTIGDSGNKNIGVTVPTTNNRNNSGNPITDPTGNKTQIGQTDVDQDRWIMDFKDEEPNAIQCKQHWYRIYNAQKHTLKGLQKLRRIDCGVKGMHWRWWRDQQIARKKRKSYI